MSGKLKVGVAGLGIMGSGIALNLAKRGLLAGIYNRTEKRSEEFIEKLGKEGIATVKIAKSPKELAQKIDVVLTCVSNDQAMEEIVFGKEGILEGISKDKILLDSSTTSSDFTKKMKDALKDKEAHLVAGPMTGSRVRAHNGTLTFMVGGDKKIAFSLKQVFEAIGERAVYLGSAEVAQDFKALANQLQADMLVSYAFKVLTGLAADAPMSGMQEIIDNTAAMSGVSKFKASFIVGGDFGETHDKVHFELNLMLKDLRLAKKVREKTGIKDPVADKTLEIFEEASKEGYGKKDFAAVADYIQNNKKYNSSGKKITGNLLTNSELIVGKPSR